MRALIVTNMYPSPENPVKGRFVYDQVAALREMPNLEIELFSFDGGSSKSYFAAAKTLRKQHHNSQFDIIHAHFGLTAWVSLALRRVPHAVTLHGTDLVHPRSRKITLAALPRLDLIGIASDPLRQQIPARFHPKVKVLPCGIDLARFKKLDRAECRKKLGLDAEQPFLLFPADPSRPEKRFELASELAEQVDAKLITLGNTDPADVPLFMNAANAVLVTSERESFGLAALEALACDVPVLSTNVGMAPQTVGQVDGCLCQPFEIEQWQAVARTHLANPQTRVEGRELATTYGSTQLAQKLVSTWEKVVSGNLLH